MPRDAQSPVQPQANYEIRVVGAQRSSLRDFYHALLRLPWAWTFLVIAFTFLLSNALFAIGFYELGGVAHARAGSYRDAYFFSVQTMATIGYGAMYPESVSAHCLVVGESITGLILTALATGLVFAKFSRPTARMVFSRRVAISRMNGVPTLSFRVGNARSNNIIDAQLHVTLVRTEITSEGDTFYRMYDLKLVRTHALTLSRSFTVMHVIDANSPLFGATPESVSEQETELLILVVGADDIAMQPVHATYRYMASDLVWGARHVDILHDSPELMLVDLTRFHDLESTPPSPDFPYSAEIEKSR
ncbi:MAG TPA: ion channel [Polyangiaceae bacterium]|nr:ion channel [Polyangiaceae bacterium]